jgi:peptidyl-prolyl cis-trans isomerase C
MASTSLTIYAINSRLNAVGGYMNKTVLILVVILTLIACSKKDIEQKEPYLAKVGDITITQADFEGEFQALPDYTQKMFEGAEGKEMFLGEIIKKEIMYQEALKKEIDKGAEFQKKLEEFKKVSLISELFEKEILSKAKVSDEEIRDFFEKNKEEFTTTSHLRASHILVKTKDEANKILTRIEEGEKFVDIAKEASIDKTSAKNGGDLGFFSKGQMVPEFENAASALEVGVISDPVKTPFGYHIIKVTDRKKGPVVEFDRVKDMITQKLSGEKQKEVFDNYITELKLKYEIEINKEALTKFYKTDDKTKKSPSLTEQIEEIETETKQPAEAEEEKSPGANEESMKDKQ